MLLLSTHTPRSGSSSSLTSCWPCTSTVITAQLSSPASVQGKGRNNLVDAIFALHQAVLIHRVIR